MGNPFITPDNERSFSSLIDECVMETGRPDNFRTIVAYGNAVIRECQAFGLFAKDKVEDSLVADASPFIWTRPPYFRNLAAISYGCGVYPKLRYPGRAQLGECNYFYAADDYYVFVGAAVGQMLPVAYYMWAKPLRYYKKIADDPNFVLGGNFSNRLAYFDGDIDKWQYLNGTQDGYVDTTGDPTVDENYRKLSANWLVTEWKDLIAVGIKARVYAQYGDTDRANRSYAAYKQFQNQFRETNFAEADDEALQEN